MMTPFRFAFRSFVPVPLVAEIVGLAILLAGPPSHAADGLEPVTAYAGAFVLDPAGDHFASDSTILVRGGKIVAVGKTGSVVVPAGSRNVLLAGKYIIPGLINTHVHVATLARPRDARAYLRRELYSGVTMVRDMAGDARLIAELKREAVQDEIIAPDIYFAALMAGESFFKDPRAADASRGIAPGSAPWMRAINPKTDLRLAVAEAKGTGATAIKIYADLPAELVAAIATEAHRQNLRVWAHAAVFPARPSEVVDAGVDVMSHADILAFESATPFPESYEVAKHFDLRHWRMSPAIDAVLSSMAKHGTILDATIDVGTRSPLLRWPSSLAPALAREAYHHGVTISAGTDDDADWNDLNSALLAEIERLVQDVGMSTADALRAATVNGAKAVGEEEDAGTLAKGYAANFVVLKADPLRDIRNLRSVELVVKRGRAHLRSAYRAVTAREMTAGDR